MGIYQVFPHILLYPNTLLREGLKGMSNKGLAKVSRRRLNLETVVFRAEQEVTVPVSIKIPTSTQYLLHPVLMMTKHKWTIHQSPGRIRVQGQLEGFLSCVDGDEAVHTISVPPMDFMTAFTVPILGPGTNLETDAVIEGVEVDRGENNVANITAFVTVTLWALKCEETDLVTAVTGDSLVVNTQNVNFQHIIKEAETEKLLTIQISAEPGAKPVGTDFCIGNLSWQVVDGKLEAEGLAMVKLYCLSGENGVLDILEESQEFELDLDFGSPEVSDSTLQCYPVTLNTSPAPDGASFKLELVLKATARGYREITGDYITSLTGADSLEKEIHLRNRIGESEFKLNLEGPCQFPGEPVEIGEVLPKVRIIEVKALDEKVMVRGLLSLNIFYTDAGEKSRVLVQEEEFSQHFDLKGCGTGYHVKAWAWPERGICNEDHFSVPLLLRVEVVEDVEFRAVTDVHIVDKELPPVNASVVLYVARKDDSLFTVARKFNITQQMLRDYNSLTEVDEIHFGQKLLIPVYQCKV